MQFADRLKNVETSAIRELFKLLGKPGIISFAGGFPDPALFDVEGIKEASNAVLTNNPGPVLQYGATEGYQPLREGLSTFMSQKGATVTPDGLIVTTGSQQALDLIGKCMISPGDKVIVEAPTFLATIQCFRLYGAEIIGAPIDADGVDVDQLEKLILEHKPKLVYLEPDAAQADSGNCSPHQNVGGGRRSIRRTVFRQATTAKFAGPERRYSR
jgi:2-aminoadipate transaminase